ncbi:hypothetical protein FXN61_42015 [Lentzea sp. PSKA42]|uniref:DUF7736 domain-containing protein n=1 Tax=Lentzea indica TaxID=2604800 RepID=A0ABX1FWI5_9PSEU|nr:hypothetical protein [Lentzea indica]NKE62951.1 hypothetical protein [Lentzea indica]
MEPSTKNFDLYTVLAVTHRLPSDLGPYVEILSWMVGKTVNQFEWISAHPICGEALAEQHPQLRDIPAAPDFDGDERRMDAWADEQKARIGVSSLPVAPLSPDKREEALSVDAVAEAISLYKVWHLDLNKPDLGFDKPTD